MDDCGILDRSGTLLREVSGSSEWKVNLDVKGERLDQNVDGSGS